jgi:hypothetical protein
MANIQLSLELLTMNTTQPNSYFLWTFPKVQNFNQAPLRIVTFSLNIPQHITLHDLELLRFFLESIVLPSC